jgi:hypothetical protein
MRQLPKVSHFGSVLPEWQDKHGYEGENNADENGPAF